MEMFKTIKEYPLYSVSTDGQIRKNSNNRYLHPSVRSDGYYQINLKTGDGRRKKEYVHRLVALTFLPNENKYPEVNHIDGVRSNNRVSNLEWVTHADNMANAIFLNKAIRVCDSKGDEVGVYHSVQAACNELGLTSSNVSACLHRNRQKTHKGYTFELIS